MDRLNDIQAALKPLKKFKLICMTIFELPKSFKTMNRPDRNAFWRIISRKIIKDRESMNFKV